MRVLVLNCGSSSLKFRVVDICHETSNIMLSGIVDRIGGLARLSLDHDSMSDLELQQDIRDHDQAVRWALDRCKRCEVEAVGHRVVHGGANFQQPVRIDATVMAEIEQLSELAPLHNPACLAWDQRCAGGAGARYGYGHGLRHRVSPYDAGASRHLGDPTEPGREVWHHTLWVPRDCPCVARARAIRRRRDDLSA